MQNRVTDTWAYYQAKNTQRQTTELFLDMLRISEFKDQKTAEALKDKYQDISKSLGGRQDEIKNEARSLEKEMDVERRRADRFDLGESFLEIALVVTSITLLTRKRFFGEWDRGGSHRPDNRGIRAGSALARWRDPIWSSLSSPVYGLCAGRPISA